MKKVLFLAAAVATLFASCSKDATQDVATVQTGDAAFYASMSFEAAETTRHFINDENEYQWEAGDMVGVATGDTTVPFVTIQGGVNAAFQAVGNDLDFLGDEPFYMAYPYGTKVVATPDATTGVTTVTGLKVPATQRFRANSFSTMTAPAFAYVEDFANGDQVEFQAAASMIEIPLIGKGAIKKLTLSAPNYALAGDINAVMSENEAGESVVKFETVNGTNSITLEFGESQFDLEYFHSEDKAKVVFVVAPGKVTAAETMTLTATFAGENAGTATATFTVPANTEFAPNKLFALEPKTLGLNDYTLITNEVEFITYLKYQRNTKGLVVSDLDFESFDAQAAFAELGAIASKTPTQSNQYSALRIYINNDNTISQITNGAIIGGCSEPSVINGLVVKGFDNENVSGISAGAALENIKFTNSVVVANTENAGFLAADAHVVPIKNVVIGEGNVLNASAATGYIGGIVGRLFTDSSKIDNIEVVELPTIINTLSAEGGAQYVGEAYGYVNAAANYVIDMEAIKASSLNPVVNVVAAVNNSVIEFKNAAAGVAYDDVFVSQAANPASIVVNGVSYWNGVKAAAVNKDAYYTAEELARDLYVSDANVITLTHDIDMQGILLKDVDHNRDVKNVITSTTDNVFEIKNVKVAIYKESEAASLFGKTSDVSNVKLTNVELNVNAGAFTQISGVTLDGTVDNVTVDGLVINIAKELEPSYVGGVFAKATTASVKGEGVEVKSCAINYEGEVSANVGIVAGILTINPDATETLKGITLSTKKSNFSVSANLGKWWLKDTTKYALADVTAANSYAGRYPIGVVSVANAAFPTNSNSKAYLAVEDFQSWSDRLAAGVVFADALTSKTKDFVCGDSETEYKYSFTINGGAQIGTYSTFGFTKK